MKMLKTIALLAFVAPLATGCATKGWVQARIDDSFVHTDTMVANESRERVAQVEALRGDIAALRGSMDTLRNDFNVRITALEDGIRFAMPVHFGFNEASVRPEDQEALNRFAQIANRYYQGSLITIEGFADPAGTRAYNLRLSQRRAENVRQYLVAQGLMTEQLRSVGYGFDRQVVRGARRDDPGAEQNRRVVFVVESRGPMRDAVAMHLEEPRQ